MIEEMPAVSESDSVPLGLGMELSPGLPDTFVFRLGDTEREVLWNIYSNQHAVIDQLDSLYVLTHAGLRKRDVPITYRGVELNNLTFNESRYLFPRAYADRRLANQGDQQRLVLRDTTFCSVTQLDFENERIESLKNYVYCFEDM